MVSLLLLVVFFLLFQVVGGVLLWIGAKVARIPHVSILRTILVAILLTVLGLVVAFGAYTVGPTIQVTPLVLAGVELLVSLPLSWLVVMKAFRTSFVRAILAWLPLLLSPVLAIGFLYGVSKPFLFESWVAVSNNMAPTLVGEHRIGTCMHCGDSLVVPQPRYPDVESEELAICQECRRTSTVRTESLLSGQPDRFICNKLLTPRRWDLIVFRYPGNPTTKYVMRLVGLPGEEIIIRDGAVWANGAKLEPPQELSRINYSAVPGFQEDFAGSAAKPARLGEDEYFVLGDFSERSADSRLWFEGADGHPPYALPGSYIDGVVDLVYWPSSRIRLLR